MRPFCRQRSSWVEHGLELSRKAYGLDFSLSPLSMQPLRRAMSLMNLRVCKTHAISKSMKMNETATELRFRPRESREIP